MTAQFIEQLTRGCFVTICITLASAVGATVCALAAGLARASAVAVVRWATMLYVEIFRGTSLLVQLFWIFFVLPVVGLSLQPLTAAILTLSLNFGAYGSEIVRGSLLAVPTTQIEAGRSLSLTKWQGFFLVVVPQALPVAIPAWGNLMIELLKASSLVSLLGLSDLMFTAYQLNMVTLKSLPIFGLVAIYYLILAGGVSGAFRFLERACTRFRV
jgi:polar amino acid transport system permease protein